MMPETSNITRLHPQRAAIAEHIVREHLDRVLQSSQFDAAERSRSFLCFVVDEALAGRGAELKQSVIAMSVFGRKADFDPVLDPIVRVQAGRLRRSLERYYLITGDTNPIRIELPRGSYTPVFMTAATQNLAKGSSAKRITLMQPAPDWPIVVIQPFTALSCEGDVPASRLEDELTMELCRYGNVRVVLQRDIDRLDLRQQTALRFDLQGSLRREADDYLISARLVDRTTGEQVWSEEYPTSAKPGRWSGGIDDIGRVIAARTGAEHGVIARLLASGFDVQLAEANTASSAIRCCYHFFFSRQVRELIPAIKALQRITAREPEIAMAWTYLARLYLVNYSFGLSDLPTPIEKAIYYAYQSVLLDPVGARGRCVLGAALLVKGELRAARDELDQALQLNTDSLAYREIIGWLMALAGDWERGMALMCNAMARNPYCLPQVKHGLWADCLRRSDFTGAYLAALEYQDSSFFWRELMTTCCLGHLDRLTEARASVADLLQAKPDFPQRGRTLIGYYIKSAELRERVVEGLHKAGLLLD